MRLVVVDVQPERLPAVKQSFILVRKFKRPITLSPTPGYVGIQRGCICEAGVGEVW